MQMQGLAKAIALPNMHAPARFPSFPALERTAVMGFSAPSVLSVGDTTNPSHMMLCRQAAWPCWATELSDFTWSYTVDYITSRQPTTGTTNQITTLGVSEGLVAWCVGNRAATPYLPGIIASNPPPFWYPLLGMDSATSSKPWTYITGPKAVVVISRPSKWTNYAIDGELNYEVWTSPGEVSESWVSFTITAGVCGTSCTILPLGEGMWIRPKLVTYGSSGLDSPVPVSFYISITVGNDFGAGYAPSPTDAGNVTVLSSVLRKTFSPKVFPSEFVNSSLPWESTRTTAVAVLGTNVTQLLNKGGTILCGRVSPENNPPWAVTQSYINSLHPAEKAFLPFETGVYSYTPPSTDLSTFWDYTVNTNRYGSDVLHVGIPRAPVYRLDNDSLVNHLFFSAPAGQSETVAVTVDWHLEFRTSSALFQIGLSTLTLESLHMAQVALATAGFFFENPEHAGILRKVVDAVKKYGPSAVGAFNPVAGKMAGAVVKIMSNKPKAKMKSTSAAGAGILPPKGANSRKAGKKQKKKPGPTAI